jgi:hypothetical protein
VWEILGLEVDGEKQCFRVPLAKRVAYGALHQSLHNQLDGNTVNLYELSSFAGKSVYYTQAIAMLRSNQNITYACLANNGDLGRSHSDRPAQLWWELPRNTAEHLRLTAETSKLLQAELDVCNYVVQLNQDWGFFVEKHSSVITHWSDATPYQGGNYIKLRDGAELPEGWNEREIMFGGSLPSVLELPRVELDGTSHTLGDMVASLMPEHLVLTRGNIGVAEGVALIIGLITIDNNPILCPLYSHSRVDFHIDNTEMLWMFRRRRVSGGEHRLCKIAMLQCLQHYEIKWQMESIFHYVRSEDNPADAPSRDRLRSEYRLGSAARKFLWNEHGPFTLDWMASHVTCMRDKHHRRIPYYSKDIDPFCAGINVLANAVHTDSDGSPIDGYCFPPFVMLDAITLHGEQEEAQVLLVHPRIYEPKPAWAMRLLGFHTRALPACSAERRSNNEWTPIPNLELAYTFATWNIS